MALGPAQKALLGGKIFSGTAVCMALVRAAGPVDGRPRRLPSDSLHLKPSSLKQNPRIPRRNKEDLPVSRVEGIVTDVEVHQI